MTDWCRHCGCNEQRPCCCAKDCQLHTPEYREMVAEGRRKLAEDDK